MKLLKILIEQQVINTILPSINIWLLYILVLLIITGIFNIIVAGIFFVLFQILGWSQTETTKKAFRTFWYENLPIFKFHLVLVVIESSIIFFITNKFNVLNNLIGGLDNKNQQNAK